MTRRVQNGMYLIPEKCLHVRHGVGITVGNGIKHLFNLIAIHLFNMLWPLIFIQGCQES